MPKIVDEQMREATQRHIIRQAACKFARLGDEAVHEMNCSYKTLRMPVTSRTALDGTSHKALFPMD